MFKGRKHGIFAVSGDVVSYAHKEERKDALTLELVLNTGFQQCE